VTTGACWGVCVEGVELPPELLPDPLLEPPELDLLLDRELLLDCSAGSEKSLKTTGWKIRWSIGVVSKDGVTVF